MRRRPLSHEDGVFLLALAAAAVPTLIALPILWFGDYEAKTQWTFSLLIVVGTTSFAAAARARVVRPLYTLANLVAALRERDYSVRGRHIRKDDSLGVALAELAA